MGHRANFVVIRGGDARAYFDSWAALGCIHSVADGPEDAAASAAQFEATDELLDWAFMEGGYLVDFDEKTLIVFGLTDEDLADEFSEFEDDEEEGGDEADELDELDDDADESGEDEDADVRNGMRKPNGPPPWRSSKASRPSGRAGRSDGINAAPMPSRSTWDVAESRASRPSPRLRRIV